MLLTNLVYIIIILLYVGKFWSGKFFGEFSPANIYKYDEIPEQNYYNNGGTAKVF